MAQRQPSPETLDRIKNLSYVGSALFGISNDFEGQNKFFLAKEALHRFESGINELVLDAETLAGIKDLIKFLNSEIDRRLRQVS